MFAADFQTMAHRRAGAGLVAAQALIDAALHLAGHMLHGSSPLFTKIYVTSNVACGVATGGRGDFRPHVRFSRRDVAAKPSFRSCPAAGRG